MINMLLLFFQCSNVSTLPLKGFYYDAHYKDLTLNDTHFGLIEKQAKKVVSVCYHILLNSVLLKFLPTLILWPRPNNVT